MNINDTIFEGATKILKERKTNKRVKRGGLVCSCGALNRYFTALPYWHEDTCSINEKKKTKRKRRKR